MNNLKMLNSLEKEKMLLNLNLDEESLENIKLFLKRNPNFLYNRMSGKPSLFNYEKEKNELFKLKNKLKLTRSELYHLIYLMKD